MVRYFDKRKVVQVGVGNWGCNHLRVLTELLPHRAVGFYEPATNARKTAREVAPSAEEYETYESVLNDDDVTAVVITTPTNLHFPLALEALRAGKNVFVEKPLATRPEDGEVLVNAAAAGDLTLAVGHILLFDPGYLELKREARGKSIGDLFYVLSERAKHGTVRTAESVLLSLASHDVSLVMDLLGGFPETVSCNGTYALNGSIMDAASLVMTFGRIKAYVFVSWLHPVTARRVTVVGSRESVVWDETSAGLTIIRKGAKTSRGIPRLYDEGAKSIKVGTTDKLKAELKDFLRSVKSGEEPRCGGRKGLAVVEVLSACEKSATLGGAPVNLTQSNLGFYAFNGGPRDERT